MLNTILNSCKYVSKNAKHVQINYEKIPLLIDELLAFKHTHYLLETPYNIYDMPLEDLINFLLIYDAINFSFWGNPKWTIKKEDKTLDGGTALLYVIFNLFKDKDSKDVLKFLEHITLEDFKTLFEGNVEIPLLNERHKIITSIAKTVNNYMNGSFYNAIKGMSTDEEIFKVIIDYFPSFEDVRSYNGKFIHFYKLAQLLTSDILHILKIKAAESVSYSKLTGCADYKIPQILNNLGILEYDEELNNLIESQTPIPENSTYEVEIRACMIIVINYIYEIIDRKIDRIDINDFIWSKGQKKTKCDKPYHLTRTKSY